MLWGPGDNGRHGSGVGFGTSAVSSSDCEGQTSAYTTTVSGYGDGLTHTEFVNKIMVPEVYGNGYDSFGSFVIDPFGSTEVTGNTATTQYVKQYSSGWELQIKETFPDL